MKPNVLVIAVLLLLYEGCAATKGFYLWKIIQ